MWSLIADITRASRLSCLTASFAALQANTHSRAWKRAANLRAGAQSTCFTSTKVQTLPRTSEQARALSVSLLYWYKSANTDT
jgi:hypothetical protein